MHFNKSGGHALPRSAAPRPCPGTRHAHASTKADAAGAGERAERPDSGFGGKGGENAAFQPGGAGKGGVPCCCWGSEMGRARAAPLRIPIRRPTGSPSPLPQITGGWESFLGKHHLLVLFLYSFLCIWMRPRLQAGYETVPRCDPAWLLWGMNQRRSIPASPCSRARVGYPLPPAGAARGAGCPAPSDQPLQHREKRV